VEHNTGIARNGGVDTRVHGIRLYGRRDQTMDLLSRQRAINSPSDPVIRIHCVVFLISAFIFLLTNPSVAATPEISHVSGAARLVIPPEHQGAGGTRVFVNGTVSAGAESRAAVMDVSCGEDTVLVPHAMWNYDIAKFYLVAALESDSVGVPSEPVAIYPYATGYQGAYENQYAPQVELPDTIIHHASETFELLVGLVIRDPDDLNEQLVVTAAMDTSKWDFEVIDGILTASVQSAGDAGQLVITADDGDYAVSDTAQLLAYHELYGKLMDVRNLDEDTNGIDSLMVTVTAWDETAVYGDTSDMSGQYSFHVFTDSVTMWVTEVLAGSYEWMDYRDTLALSGDIEKDIRMPPIFNKALQAQMCKGFMPVQGMKVYLDTTDPVEIAFAMALMDSIQAKGDRYGGGEFNYFELTDTPQVDDFPNPTGFNWHFGGFYGAAITTLPNGAVIYGDVNFNKDALNLDVLATHEALDCTGANDTDNQPQWLLYVKHPNAVNPEHPDESRNLRLQNLFGGNSHPDWPEHYSEPQR